MIPLVRHIDAALGDAGASRFYRDRTDRTLRIVWRRQRVSALAAWGWLCSLAAIGTALALVLLQVAGQPRLSNAGDLLVAVWDRVPGHEIISAPVAAFEAVARGAPGVRGSRRAGRHAGEHRPGAARHWR